MKLKINSKSVDLDNFAKKYSQGVSAEKFCNFINQHNIGISAKVKDSGNIEIGTKYILNSKMNISSPETKYFWERAIKAAKEVDTWPEWKRSF